MNILKKKRLERKLTAKRVAKELGISRQALHSLESGKHKPSAKTILSASRFYGIRAEEIIQDFQENNTGGTVGK